MNSIGKPPRLWPIFVLMIATSIPWIAGCPTPGPVPPPGPDADAATPVSCAVYCEHLRAVCPEDAKTTPKGATCEMVCENYQRSGIVKRGLACEMHASSCSAVRACEE